MKDTIYDVDSIVTSAKKNLFKFIFIVILDFAICIACGRTAYVYSEITMIPVICLCVLLISYVVCMKILKKLRLTDYKKATGMIVNVHKEVKTIDTKAVGGLNIFGFRKYDSYAKDEIRLTVFIDNKESVTGFYLENVTEKHVKYYESHGESIHIWGTRFPVKTNIENNQWLCPVCGEFNSEEEKVCSGCKIKILK